MFLTATHPAGIVHGAEGLRRLAAAPGTAPDAAAVRGMARETGADGRRRQPKGHVMRRTLPKPGHAPGHIREAFLESIKNRAPDRALAGKLWSCTDIMPGGYCELLFIPTGSTYAQAARFVRQQGK